jgi:hypothetical protein
MIKNIIILIVFALAIFLLNRYYQQSSLNFKGGTVLLEVKGKRVSLNSSSVKSTTEHFSNVDIVQKELSIEGSRCYYEEASIDGLYEFNHNIKVLIDKLFETKKIENIFSIHELHAMQVTTKSGEVINLFVTDNDNKEFHLFYGLPNKLFRSTILTLSGTDKFGFELADVVELNEAKTKWTVLNNDINGIISSIDY